MSDSGPFAGYISQAWPYRFRVELVVSDLHGGVPRNPDVVRSWLIAKAGWTDELQIEAEIERIFRVDPDQTDEQVAEKAVARKADQHVNGFKRDEHGLYLEGRQLKAGLKEAASVARGANKLAKTWGETRKGVLGFVAEHIQVVEDRLYLGRDEHDELHTRFVSVYRGSGITVEEVCRDVKISATVTSDYKFTDQEWAMIWLTGEMQGIGASRSQGFGRYTVTVWQPVT